MSEQIHEELWIEIFAFVDLPSLVTIMCTCSGMCELADSELSWKLRNKQHYSPTTLSRWNEQGQEKTQKEIYKHYSTHKMISTNVNKKQYLLTISGSTAATTFCD
jgi:hypothetical protein